MTKSIEKRRKQVLNQILETLGVPTSGPVPNVKMDVLRSATALVSEKRMTCHILDRIERLMLDVDALFKA